MICRRPKVRTPFPGQVPNSGETVYFVKGHAYNSVSVISFPQFLSYLDTLLPSSKTFLSTYGVTKVTSAAATAMLFVTCACAAEILTSRKFRCSKDGRDTSEEEGNSKE